MFSDNKNILIGILLFIFCFSLFKNIAYPLIWNDESESTMMATRVLKYGYPKVNDGKNRIFAPDIPSSDIGYNKKYDACSYITWGNYYFSTIGVTLAQLSDDFYGKTEIIRLPYAVIGLAGLLIFIFSIYPFFPNKNSYKWFIILFLFMELLSISLILHLRDARSYPLVIFICACFFAVYTHYYFIRKNNYARYVVLMFLILTAAFHTNFMTFGDLIIIYAIHQGLLFGLEWLKLKEWNKRVDLLKLYLKDAVPLILAVAVAVPFLQFFEIFKTSKAVSEYHHYNFDAYLGNLKTILHFFSDLEFLYLALIIKAILLGVMYLAKDKPAKIKNQINSKLRDVSFFTLVFILVYAAMVARIPYYIFARYVIVLQVMMTMMMLVDLFVIADYVNILAKKGKGKGVMVPIVVLLGIVFFVNVQSKMEYVKGHIYELFHPYKGVLDYTIPYIRDNYKNTDTLTIATNYEEYSYMYYLGSKVIIGYALNNVEEDMKHIPDIIMYRKTWGTDPKYFNEFMQKAKYQRVGFPVADYPVNNIPELDFVIKHLFKTKLATSEKEQAEMYVRVK